MTHNVTVPGPASVQLPVIYITTSTMDRTTELLASFAAIRPNEGVVYWFGLELGDRSIVTTLIVPNADTRRGEVHTTAAANAEAVSGIVGTPLVLLGQAHSHPGFQVGHSSIDDRDTFCQFTGALSIVVPFFGFYGADLTLCGVHRHMNGAYYRIPATDVGAHLVVLPGERDFRRSYSGDEPAAPWSRGVAQERRCYHATDRTEHQAGHQEGCQHGA